MSIKITLVQQIFEVQRELDQRDKVYGRLVRSGRMRQSEADYQIDHMRAVLKTLEFVRDNADLIRRVHAAIADEGKTS